MAVKMTALMIAIFAISSHASSIASVGKFTDSDLFDIKPTKDSKPNATHVASNVPKLSVAPKSLPNGVSGQAHVKHNRTSGAKKISLIETDTIDGADEPDKVAAPGPDAQAASSEPDAAVASSLSSLDNAPVTLGPKQATSSTQRPLTTAASMEAELMNLLLGKSTFGATPMGGSVKKIFNILTKEMMPKVIDAHKADQNELNTLMAELKNCFTVRNRALKSAAPWKTKYAKQSTLHKECRSDEAVKYSSKEACLKQQRALYEVKKLKCEYFAAKSTQFGSSFNNKAIVTKAGSESVRSYIVRISGTICGKHVHGERGQKKEGGGWGGGLLGGMLDQYLKAKFACEVATKNYNDKVKECKQKIHEYNVRKGKCNQFQTLMDSRSCKFAVLVKDTCEQYAGCYASRRKSFEIARANILMQERDRKAEWRGLKRISCLISAFADGQVSDKEIDECKKKTVTTTHLIIKYPKIPYMSKCVTTKLYPATGAYKRKEFAPLPTLAKGKVSVPCSGVENIPTKPRKGSPKECKCRRVTLEGHYQAGPLVKCTGCHDIRRSEDKSSCPMGTKLFAPASRTDWKTFFTSAKPLGQPHWIIDITRPQNGCGGCTSNPMNWQNQNQKSWKTSDKSPWWLRSTKFSEPNGDYSANCFLGLGKKNKDENLITFNDKGCSYHSKAYYCQKIRFWAKPKKGSPKSCKCQPITLASRYSTKLLVVCKECLTVSRSLEKNSCPKGMKIFSPRSRADWKTFIISAAPLRAPNWIIDITRPQNGCGGCTKYAMNSNVPQQATWRTADKSPWWLRSNKYNQPNGDYRANCYMDLFRRPTSESAVQFRGAKPLKDGQYAHKGCSYSARSYYCQPKMHKSKIKKPPPQPKYRRLVANSLLKSGLRYSVFYKVPLRQGKYLPTGGNARKPSRILSKRAPNWVGVQTKATTMGPMQLARMGISKKNQKDFVMQWTGYLIIPMDGKYGFRLDTSDGSKLFINGKAAIMNDGMHRMRQKTVVQAFEKGQQSIVVEFFKSSKSKSKNPGFKLQYKAMDKKAPRRFRRWTSMSANSFVKLKYVPPQGFKEEIFYSHTIAGKIPDLNAKPADVERFVPRVVYSATKAPWRGFTKKDSFAVRWSGILQITKPGSYKFSVRSDDGSKFWVNRRLLVNNDGVRHGMVNVEGTITMQIRKYRLILEYFEKGSKAGMLLRYMGPDTNTKMIPVGSKIDKQIVLRAIVGTTKTPAIKKKKAPMKKLKAR